jgi:uncharacterized membrane protein YccC
MTTLADDIGIGSRVRGGSARRRAGRLLDALRSAASWLQASSVYFALTTTAAALLALYVAFWLALDSPSTAMVTVLIVAAPIRGMVLSKSLYRLLGTFVGGTVALVLVDLCGQYSELFIAAVALWVGLCTTVAIMLRNFRAYAAVLSGYTVPLIGMAAIQVPDHAFDIASARVAAITVGVVCAGLVSTLCLPGGARKDLLPRLQSAIQALLSLARDTLAPSGGTVGDSRFVEVTGHILGLDTLVEFAATESPRTARQANALRSALGALIGAVTTLRAIADVRAADAAVGKDLIAEFRDHLDRLAERLSAGDGSVGDLLAEIRGRLRLSAQRFSAGTEPSLRELQLLGNLDELIDQFEAVLLDLEAFTAERSARTVASIGYYVDVETALRNGFRALLGVISAGAFCYATGWSDGAQAPVAVAVICSLLALTPNPAKASIAFAIGVVLADIAAIFCEFGLLAPANGFPLLAMAMGPLLFVSLLSPANPLLAGIAGGFRIFFVVALSPTNPMVFNPATTLNNALVSVVGAVFAAYFYRAILPFDEKAEPKRLMRMIRNQLERASSRPVEDRAAFESKIYHLLITLSTRLGTTRTAAQPLLAQAYAESRLALAVQRARIALAADNLPDEARRSFLTATADPKASTLLEATHRLAAMSGAAVEPDRAPLLRAAAALAEAAAIAASPTRSRIAEA